MGDGNKINLGTHGASYSGNLWQHSNAPIRKSVLGCHAHSEHKDLFLDEKIPTVAEVSTFKMAPIYKEGADNFGYDDLPGWAQVVHDVGEVALYINPLMWPFLLAGCEESTYEQGAATFYYVGDMPVEVTAADVTPDSQDIGPDVVIDVDGGKKDIPIDIKFGCPTPVERDCTVEGMEGDCASGVEYCTEDAFGNPSWSECESKNTEPEKCDSLDNDCDGETDEDFDLEIPCSDGQGECFAGGVTVCNEAGDDVVCNVLPGASKVEICDNLDNDCDGLTDEDFSLGESCSDGEGECYAEGETTCNELGDGVACSAVKGEQADEICDNLDNDCDSFTDEAPNNAEALTQACIPPGSSAECENGSQVCEEGGLWSPCEPTGLTEEVCDGLDNDCNGETDEAYEDLGDLCTVGVGICENEGEKVCAVDHESTICDVEPLPALPEELCNYLDDTCDGETDEGFDLWSTCSVGHGPCETEGAKVCTADGETTECNAVPDLTQASNELCDNVDDDCDGIIDNVSTLGDLCTKGAGICFSEGVLVCTPDSLVPTCNAFDIPPQEEVCDGLDNNCDGDTDNVLGLGEACDNGLQGACLKEGEMVCDGDDLVCDAPLILSEAETCQNFGTDDNCDGILDNVIGLGDLCDNGLQGACFDAGEMVCSGGILVCSASIKEGVQETCGNMGVDNDCDGALDNVPGLDDECDNDLSGACFATGLMVCVGDELKCDAPLLEGAAETCANMGVDNDCDGEEDNIPGEFDDCNNGLFGNCLAQGVMVCVGDDLSCNAAIPEPENET